MNSVNSLCVIPLLFIACFLVVSTIVAEAQELKPFFHLFSSSFINVCVFTIAKTAEADSLAIDYINKSVEGKIVVWCSSVCHTLIMKQAIEGRLFWRHVTWLFVQNSLPDKEVFLDYHLSSYSVRLDSNILIFAESAPHKEYSFEICRVRHDGPNITYCDLKLTYSSAKWQSTSTESHLLLKGFHLKVGIAHLPPVAEIRLSGNTTQYEGYAVQITELLSKCLGFSYEFIRSKEQTFGTIVNGSWIGLVGMLHRKEVDFVPVTISLTPDRLSTADFTPFLTTVSTVAIIRKRKNAEDTFDTANFTRPFSKTMWMTFLVMCIITFFCLWYMLKYGSPVAYNNVQPTNWKDILWSIVSSCLQMGLSSLPRNRSSQIVLLMFLVFILVISKSYFTSLTSSLTVQKKYRVYQTIDELLGANEHRVSITRGLSQTDTLKNVKSGTLASLWEKISSNDDFVSSTEEGIKRVLEGKYAYLNGLNLVEHLIMANCNLTYVKEKILKFTTHVGLQKNSPYQEAISSAILRLRSSGLLDNLSDKSKDKLFAYGDCLTEDKTVKIGLFHISGVFFLLICGQILGLVLFCVELYSFKLNGHT